MAERPSKDADLDRAIDAEYAAVSTPAVLGAVCGTLGVTAFLAPPLVAVPVLAIALSLVALRRIRRSRGVLTGGRLALVGLLLGIGLTLGAGGYHAWSWYKTYPTLEPLRRRTHAIMDEITGRRWQEAFERITPQSPQRQAGFDLFRDRLTGLFAGAGDPVQRDLRALQIFQVETGERVAMAQVWLHLEHRTLEFNLSFQADEEGNWQFVGVAGRETFESTSIRGRPEPPRLRGPFERR